MIQRALVILGLALTLGCEDSSRTDSQRASRQLPFNEADWKRSDQYFRGRMVDDLVNSGLLIGKSKEQVKSILGDPSEEWKGMMDYLVQTDSVWSVALYELLLVEFDTIEGRVSAVWVSD